MKKKIEDIEVLGGRVIAIRWMDDKLGEIIVPEYAKLGSLRGKVIAIGPDCTSIHVGDDVIFGRYAPFELPTRYYDDIRDLPAMFIMNEEDILLRIGGGENE